MKGTALRALVAVWIVSTWFVPALLARRADSLRAGRQRAGLALAGSLVGLLLLVRLSGGRAGAAELAAGAALVLVSAGHALR